MRAGNEQLIVNWMIILSPAPAHPPNNRFKMVEADSTELEEGL